MYKGKLGIALISFNRPEYFSQVIESIEDQSCLENTDFHLFQDGAKNVFSRRTIARQSDINKNIEIFRNSELPNKIEHIREQNIGNGINQFEAVEYMAKNYDYFMIIEDDVLLSTHYFNINRKLIDQFLRKDDVFSISISCRRECAKEDIEKNLDKVGFIQRHWWAETWSSAKWNQCRKYFLTYYQMIQSCEYEKRPHQRIRRMFKSYGFNVPQTSQDAGKDFMLYMMGMKRLTTIVNRGFYIGEHGLHFRSSTYKKYGFKDMKPYKFDSDKKLKKFIEIE